MNLQQLHQPFLLSCGFSKFVRYYEDFCYLITHFGLLALLWNLFWVFRYMLFGVLSHSRIPTPLFSHLHFQYYPSDQILIAVCYPRWAQMRFESDLLKIRFSCFAMSARSSTPSFLRRDVANCFLCDPLRSKHEFLSSIPSGDIPFDIFRKSSCLLASNRADAASESRSALRCVVLSAPLGFDN